MDEYEDGFRELADAAGAGGDVSQGASVLTVAAAAVLAGARSILATGEWARQAPQPVLAALGARHSRRHDRFLAAHTDTFRRGSTRVDATAVDTAIGLFLADRARCGGLHSTEPADAQPDDSDQPDDAQGQQPPVAGALAVDGTASTGVLSRCTGSETSPSTKTTTNFEQDQHHRSWPASATWR